MSLTLRMEELGRVRVFADLDGRMSLSLKPVEEINDTQGSASGVLIHFDTIVENGSSKLHIFTSSTTPSNSGTTTPAHTPESNDCLHPNTLGSGYLTGMAPYSSHDFLSELGSSGTSTESLLPDFMSMFSPTSESHGLSDSFEYFNMHSDTNIPLTGEPGSLYMSNAGSDSEMCLSSSSTTSTLEGESPLPKSPITFTEPNKDCGAVSPDTTPQSGARRPRRLGCLHPGCKQRFMSEYTRKLHMSKHGPKTRFPCEMGCSETFSRQHDRLRHEIAKHGRRCEWLCDNCRRFFSSKETRNKHKCTGTAAVSRWTQPATPAST